VAFAVLILGSVFSIAGIGCEFFTNLIGLIVPAYLAIVGIEQQGNANAHINIYLL
jgi:hypothetical protein